MLCPMSKLLLASCVLLTALGATSLARHSLGDDPAPWTVAIETRYVAKPTLEVPIQEISGLAVLPSSTPETTSLLVVTDEGPYDAKENVVRGALFRLDLRHDEKGTHIEGSQAIDLRVHFERFDDEWPASISPMDLESVAAVPGTDDLFLLAGERNPEDHTDDGANRLYLVRYPVGSDAHAEVIHYTRVFDLLGDSMNDRFEALALLPAQKGEP